MLIQKEKMAKGAEATIYRGSFLENPVILKQRHPKEYRSQQLDQAIRLSRLKAEARVMTLAWKIGVRVPVLLGIDKSNRTLMIEELKGITLFSILNLTTLTELKHIFEEVGHQVGLLHKNNIIHGDLTVFNVIVMKDNEPWLIDFGLSHISNEIENKADDLLTSHNTLKAVFAQYQTMFDFFQVGYLKMYKKGSKTFEHMKKIQSRARYISRDDRIE
jgi:Kae1-associated kinase Bud32